MTDEQKAIILAKANSVKRDTTKYANPELSITETIDRLVAENIRLKEQNEKLQARNLSLSEFVRALMDHKLIRYILKTFYGNDIKEVSRASGVGEIQS